MKRGPGRPPSNKTKNVDQRCAEFFKVFIPRRSSHHLMIPPDFTDYFNRIIKQKVVLKDYLGKTWDVHVDYNRTGVFLGRGWRAFVKHHGLGPADFLVFRHDGGCKFLVKIYGSNGCKKQPNVAHAKRLKIEHEGCSRAQEAEGDDLPRGPYFSSSTGKSIEIPNEVIEAYDLKSKQEMVLLDSNGKEWPVKTNTTKGGKEKSGHMYLETGWSDFQEANNAASSNVRYMFTFGVEKSSTVILVRPVLQGPPDT